jgi:hypothetical protein
MLMRQLAQAATCTLALAIAACGSSNGTPAPATPVTGALIMQWSVDETTNPNLCNATGASTFDLQIFNGAGAFAGEFTQACSAFATSVQLVEDTYTARATLLDAAGTPRTTTVNVAPFTIVGGTSLTIAVDFPANSFF